MPRFTIDRFESGEWAVLEDDRARTFRVPRKWLPADAREGDVLNASADDESAPGVLVLHLELDAAARQERRTEAKRLREQLPRGPKGDVSL